MNPWVIVGLVGGVALILAAIVVVLVLRAQSPSQGLATQLAQLQAALSEQRVQDTRAQGDSLRQMAQTVSEQLAHSNSSINQGLAETSRSVQSLLKELGEVSAKTSQITELGQTLHTLRDTLAVPKLRGTLGELWLEELLKQLLPPDCWEVQYSLSDGERVDAIIKLGPSLIPVDAKFPLESFARLQNLDGAEADKERKIFRRSVKDRIDEIRAKYIRPDCGTSDFALMYLPAESIYAEAFLKEGNLSRDDSLLAYAMRARVVPVSPHSFYAYLSAILHGLKGMRLNEHAQEIQASLSSIELELERFWSSYDKVGSHLGNAAKQYTESVRLGDRVKGKVEHLHRLSPAGDLPSSIVSSSLDVEVAHD